MRSGKSSSAFRLVAGMRRTEWEDLIPPFAKARRGHTANAKAAELILVTNNEREFKRVPGLKVQNWAI